MFFRKYFIFIKTNLLPRENHSAKFNNLLATMLKYIPLIRISVINENIIIIIFAMHSFISMVNNVTYPIGHVYECPTMHYSGIPRHTASMKAYMIFYRVFLEIPVKKLRRGNVVNIPN